MLRAIKELIITDKKKFASAKLQLIYEGILVSLIG